MQRHEVVAVRLFDPLELELPDLGLVPLTDAETGEQLWVDTHDAGFRKRFARIAAERETTLRETLAKIGVDALELSTNDDLVEAVVRFADMRKRRVARRVAREPEGGGSMNFLWPQFLWLLVAAPLLVLLYFWLHAAQEEDRAALCQPVDRARGDGRSARACGATSRPSCSCWRWSRC